MTEAWKIVKKCCGITKAQYDALLPILQRDDSLDGVIVPESEIFLDGDDTLYLVANNYLLEYNEECDFEAFLQAVAEDLSYDGEPPLIENWDKVAELYWQRQGKPIFIANDLLEYADEDYYQETEQTEAMVRFLEERLPLQDPDGELTREEFYTLSMTLVMRGLNHLMRDPIIVPAKAIAKAIELTKDLEFEIPEAELNDFVQLYTALSNHTRLPANCGRTPDEMFYARADRPRAESIGAEEKIVPFVREGSKVGPNDPCPCGSGKKYKRCCGRS